MKHHNDSSCETRFGVFNEKPIDVDSLFTDIPLEENIDICTDTLFENTKRVKSLWKLEVKELLFLATKESYVIFNGKHQRQVDRMAMNSL